MVKPLHTLQRAVEINPERCDLQQALGSLLIEHGNWKKGLGVIT